MTRLGRLGSAVWALMSLVTMAGLLPATTVPSVFWVSEPVQPGEVVLLYGGDLGGVHEVTVWRMSDDDPGLPTQDFKSMVERPAANTHSVPTLQRSESSLKFVLPSEMAQGVFAVDFGGKPDLINVPRLEWSQPTRLLPGLEVNEAAPGSEVQLIGRNLLLAGVAPDMLKVVLRGEDGRLFEIQVMRADKYSLIVALPQDLPLGNYEVWVHNGRGGLPAWGRGLRLTIKQPTLWPRTVFNMKDFGGQGNSVADDSEALRQALAAAEQNGGGIIYFPYGIYRLKGWFYIPQRVVLRGEGRDITWLKWPQAAPTSINDISYGALFGAGEYALENLSLLVRNAKMALHDLSFAALARASVPAWGQGTLIPPELEPKLPQHGIARDIFLRNVRVHYLPNSGRPSRTPEKDPQWQFNQWGIINTVEKGLTVAIGGARNVEVSDCTFEGIERLLELKNARVIGNEFRNQMGVSWTDLGGQYVVSEGNQIEGAASWRNSLLPLRRLYIAHNKSRNVERGEREAINFDINKVLAKRGKDPVDPWQGMVASASSTTLMLQGAAFLPGAYQDFDVHILDGKGAGQYRTITDNSSNSVTVSQPWEVLPDATSLVLLHRLPGHVIFYGNIGEDASVFGQVYGYLYDAVFDSNKALRSQGTYAMGGWFVQWLNNQFDAALTFSDPGEYDQYGLIGCYISGRLTTTLPLRFPYLRAAVIRGNHLSYGYRVLIMWGLRGRRQRVPFIPAYDVVINRNQIEHTPVGIELDANVAGAVIGHNTFGDVHEPLRLHDPTRVQVID